jgi:hypothetical protein
MEGVFAQLSALYLEANNLADRAAKLAAGVKALASAMPDGNEVKWLSRKEALALCRGVISPAMLTYYANTGVIVCTGQGAGAFYEQAGLAYIINKIKTKKSK